MITNIMLFYHKVSSLRRHVPAHSSGLAVALLLFPGASLTAGTILNGHEWDYVYYGSDIPIAGNTSWGVFKGSTTPHPTHVGTSLVINTNTALNQQVYYTSTEWNPSASTGIASVEVRMRLDQVLTGSSNDATIAFSVASATGGTVFYLGEGGLYLFPGSGAPVVAGFDPKQTHTYLVTLDTQAGTFSLDIDGVRKLTNHAFSNAFNSNILRIGDLSSSVGGIVTYDYVAWDNMGAPIPEPAAALLLPVALGAVALSRYRRK